MSSGRGTSERGPVVDAKLMSWQFDIVDDSGGGLWCSVALKHHGQSRGTDGSYVSLRYLWCLFP